MLRFQLSFQLFPRIVARPEEVGRQRAAAFADDLIHSQGDVCTQPQNLEHETRVVRDDSFHREGESRFFLDGNGYDRVGLSQVS